MNPEAYIDTCLYLYCSLLPKDRDDAVCDTLASYVRECAQQRIIITWRTVTLCGKKHHTLIYDLHMTNNLVLINLFSIIYQHKVRATIVFFRQFEFQ